MHDATGCILNESQPTHFLN